MSYLRFGLIIVLIPIIFICINISNRYIIPFNLNAIFFFLFLTLLPHPNPTYLPILRYSPLDDRCYQSMNNHLEKSHP